MAGLRVHVVMDPELVRRIDVVAGYRGVSRGEWLRRVALGALEKEATPLPPLEASEQALGSPGSPDAVAGVRGRVPAPVPAEQPYDASKRYDTFEEAVAKVPPGSDAVIPVYSSRVRSSAAARPFRPAPKKGEK